MHGIEEVLFLEIGVDAVVGFVVEQDGAQQGLFRLQIVRRGARRGRWRRGLERKGLLGRHPAKRYAIRSRNNLRLGGLL